MLFLEREIWLRQFMLDPIRPDRFAQLFPAFADAVCQWSVGFLR
jgi:hypothetical protein